MGRFLGVLFALYSIGSSGIDSRSCEDWIKFIGLQAEVSRARHESREIHPTLARRLGRYEAKLLKRQLVTNAVNAPPPKNLPGFDALETEFILAVDKMLPKLTQWIETAHPELDANLATKGVLRRLLSNQRFMADPALRDAVNNAGLVPSLQVLAMELWVREHETNQRFGVIRRKDLLSVIDVLNMPADQALMMLRGMNFRQEAPSAARKWWLYEIVGGVADDRVEHSAEQIVRELEPFCEPLSEFSFGRIMDIERYPRPSFGQALNRYLLQFDPLHTVHRVETLQQFLKEQGE